MHILAYLIENCPGTKESVCNVRGQGQPDAPLTPITDSANST
jgi:hypothetical protein